MIKVGIAGAEKPMAGEILRILVNHPDVEIESLLAPELRGRQVVGIHHGLIGEQPLSFSDSISDDIDFLYILDPKVDPSSLSDSMMWIDMSGRSLAELPEGTVYGLSEAFRKPLVRGARHAKLPNSLASEALIALNPLALNLMVGRKVEISVSLPKNFPVDRKDDFFREAKEEIVYALTEIQKSFTGEVNIREAEPLDSDRAMLVSVEVPSVMAVADIVDIFEGVYDDHNFTFLSPVPHRTQDVESTNKCLLRISRPDSTVLRVEALADPTMRGGAAEAVHVMNLLFGLHEKTGLALKSSRF